MVHFSCAPPNLRATSLSPAPAARRSANGCTHTAWTPRWCLLLTAQGSSEAAAWGAREIPVHAHARAPNRLVQRWELVLWGRPGPGGNRIREQLLLFITLGGSSSSQLRFIRPAPPPHPLSCGLSLLSHFPDLHSLSVITSPKKLLANTPLPEVLLSGETD